MRLMHLSLLTSCLTGLVLFGINETKDQTPPPPIAKKFACLPGLPSPIILRRITPEMRAKASKEKHPGRIKAITPVPGGQPNYYGPEGNYANSPENYFQSR